MRKLELLRQAVRRQRIIQGAGYGVKPHHDGTELIIRPGGSATATIQAVPYCIRDVAADYLVCRPIDDLGDEVGEGFEIVTVAKPRELRESTYPAGYTFGASHNTRSYSLTADLGAGIGIKTSVVNEELSPPYAAETTLPSLTPPINTVIWAVKFDDDYGTGLDFAGERLEWLDINPCGRRWQTVLRWYAVCVAGVQHYVPFRAGEPDS